MRRIGRVLLGAAVFLASLGGICAAGVATTMGQSYPEFGRRPPARGWPAAKAIPGGRITVAVVLSNAGSVSADVLAPYEVFARSERFAVYTVAARRTPSPLSGGVHLLPDHTLDEVGTGVVPEPDVVVVPAVVDPTGTAEEPLREWIAARSRHGSRLLGVCAGSELLAATGVLDNRRATSFWANIDSLKRNHPAVRWQSGERYVEEGTITTTAGITSGTVGALRMVERLAGADEARRIGGALHYPGWSLDGPTAITPNHLALSDLPYALNAAFPWQRPTIGIGLEDGVGEIDAAAAFEVYSGVSFSSRAIPISATGTVTTRHGVILLTEPAGTAVPRLDRFVVPGVRGDVTPALASWASGRGLTPEPPGGGRRDGEFGFDPMLRDLAAHSGDVTARITAKFSEYPVGQLRLSGSGWPWRSTVLFAVALAGSAGVGVLAAALPRLLRRRTAGTPRRSG
ncbi:DJ-1/PfpI family protein [Microtetraspora niveoalba]|uniref:DJ-1/PfpI family protein n=1 Tax=Microtetraspora niveoalba TaxID=46175 RepID=UPI000A669D83|nr:DJ-1/PfpI family protein [Microtetraspora niveoalba]